MAAPIAHIFLAVQMLAGPFAGHFNEKEFLIGTSFPDIRYLKVIGRADTHFTNVTLQDILNESNSFKAGMLFHSFVDEQREAYMVSHDVYEKIPSFRFTTQSLKFAEDELLRSQFDSELYKSYFDEVVNQELAFCPNKEVVKLWHQFLQNYFDKKYVLKDLLMRYFDLHDPNALFLKRWLFAWTYAYKIEQTVASIVKNKQLRFLILDFYKNFSKRYVIQKD